MHKEKPDLCAMNCHYRFYQLESFFKSASKNGYKFLEIWTGPQHFFVDYSKHESIKKLKQLEDKYQVKITGICPEQTNPKPNNIAINSFDGKKRALDYFKNIIDVASEIQAHQVVVTSGWAFYDESVDDAYNRSIELLREISEYAEERELPLAIEALQKEESLLANSADDLKKIIDDVDSNMLNVCLDIGAMEMAEDTIQTYFDTFGEKVIHSHFVDVKNDNTHIAWGDGNRNMEEDLECFSKNNYKGLLSFECVNSQYFEDPEEADKRTMNLYNSISIGGVYK